MEGVNTLVNTVITKKIKFWETSKCSLIFCVINFHHIKDKIMTAFVLKFDNSLNSRAETLDNSPPEVLLYPVRSIMQQIITIQLHHWCLWSSQTEDWLWPWTMCEWDDHHHWTDNTEIQGLALDAHTYQHQPTLELVWDGDITSSSLNATIYHWELFFWMYKIFLTMPMYRSGHTIWIKV